MQKHSWWRRLHWPEYGSELLGTAFLVFIALSAVTFNFGSDSPLAIVLPNSSVRRLITGLMLAGSGPLMSSHHLMHWTPLMTWILAALIYWQAAPISGSSLNPARSFGPALVSWFWRDQWVYNLASPIGALLAVFLFRSLSLVGINDVLTAKMFHAPRYRCIFKNVKAPQLNTEWTSRGPSHENQTDQAHNVWSCGISVAASAGLTCPLTRAHDQEGLLVAQNETV